jgi:NDP-mannose synthase
MRAVLLAGGQGTRLSPYTKVFPKPLIPLGDVPILQIILTQLHNAGFSQVTLSVSHKAHLIESYFGNGAWLGLQIDYSNTPKQLGTAGPLRLIQGLDAPFLVMNADVLTSIGFEDLIAAHWQSASIATIALTPHTMEVGFGVVEVDATKQVTRYIEKPSLNFLVSSGIYVLEPALLEYIPQGAYMDMSTLFQNALEHEHPINAHCFDGDWFDIGTISQYEKATEYFRLHRDRYLKQPAPRLSQIEEPAMMPSGR